MTAPGERVIIAGAGPTGALLSIFLARRGLEVTLFEARQDPRQRAGESGRSINLALADRGIHALRAAGVFGEVEAALIPMRGRCIHARDGSTLNQPYGRLPNEVNYSVSRHRLNQALLEVALRQPGIRAHFEHRVEDVDLPARTVQVRDLGRDALATFDARPLIAADGAGSVVRRRMAQAKLAQVSESPLAHGYKELTIAPGAGGAHRLEREALHIWPRGGYMLIALPNQDGSFTATLFLPLRGAHPSFESLDGPAAVDEFLSGEFPDARALMPDCLAEFARHPTGQLGTVYTQGWCHDGAVALIGDAAHAIVPFHGQGMNCCFEDCVELDACWGRHGGWTAAFEEFEAVRKPNTDAIAAMALDNYLEMRERVADPQFHLRQRLSHELERRFPRHFIPRYSMVMFHHEIPYRTALERGAVQERLLADLTRGVASLEQVDYARAEREILARLAPL